ncbi:cobalamin biosynthesis protein [Nocardioides sp. CFH 31398]|uniref:cobalamin biosynthesis protein n=1 Tax=Nocardioides sp. CFH 31398 TaxID=2919579 RepID=UPI001F06A164|nr:cobalamin biosynthesis protein [Nocardioides sp. CFH 31398]MCH1865548.1 cobalamin biosynthesis protein [Nocardioides sp. CFH 31398]
MTAAGLLLGHGLDRLLGDPRRGHPVAGFGALAARVESRLWADSRPRGLVHCVVLVGGTALLGAAVDRATRDHPPVRTAVVAAATWTVLGGTSLEREAHAIGASLTAGDLAAARARLPHLVGRDPSVLDADGIARAVVESVAENTSDAVVAPLVWGAIAGTPGLLAYRAANTLDAMVGHRTPRHERFGWASARLDDVLNLPGARLAGLLAVAVGPDRAGAARAWRRDAGAHPSPNAGVVEAAFAGALGLRLGGETAYPGRVEQRPRLGDGRVPTPDDVERACRLARRVQTGSALVAAAAALAVSRAPGPRRRRRR